MNSRMLCLLVGLALTVSACGDTEDTDAAQPDSTVAESAASTAAPTESEGSRQFVGAVPGSTFKLGVIASASGAWAYLCDQEGRSIELFGAVADGELSLTDSSDPTIPATATLTGRLDDNGLTGSLTLDGRVIAISAAPAVDGQGVRWKAVVDGGAQVLSTWVVAADGFGGSRLTVTASTDSSTAPVVVESSEEAPPPDAEPVPFRFGDCFRAKRTLRQLFAAEADVSDLIAADLARQSACGTLFGV